MSEESSKKLVTPRTGSQYLNRLNGKPTPGEKNLIAAWQSPEARSPKRCVVRTDSYFKTQKAEDGSNGFPCVVLRIDYTIGGLAKTVDIDALNQSALVLWAESIEVTPVWDERRISRLATAGRLPWKTQLAAASINADHGVGDVGAADARWLDMLAVDETTGEDDTTLEWSIHPIPEGARGVRFLNALASNANVETADTATFIAFSSNDFGAYPNGLVETVINGLTDQSIIIVPPGSRFLFIAFPENTISSFDEPAWIEWLMSPNTLPGY